MSKERFKVWTVWKDYSNKLQLVGVDAVRHGRGYKLDRRVSAFNHCVLVPESSGQLSQESALTTYIESCWARTKIKEQELELARKQYEEAKAFRGTKLNRKTTRPAELREV